MRRCGGECRRNATLNPNPSREPPSRGFCKSLGMKRLVPVLALCAISATSFAAQTKWIYKNPSKNANVGTLVDDADSSRVIKDVRLSDWGATTISLYSNGSTANLGDLDFTLPVESEDGATTYTIVGFGNNCFAGNTSVTSFVFPAAFTSISQEILKNATSLTNVVFPTALEKINSQAFSGCKSLKSIPAFPASLTSLGDNCFNGCSSLTGDIVLPDAVPTCNSCFRNTKITSIRLGSGMRSIGNNSFQSMTSLTNLDMTAATGLTSIGNQAFQDCTAMVCDLGTLPRTLTTLASSAFFNCPAAYGDVVLPDAISSVGSTFRKTSITSFTAGKGLTSIGNNAFQSMTSLTNLDLSPATGLLSIGQQCFADCTAMKGDLSGAGLPRSLTTLGSSVFYNCRALTGDVVLPDAVTTVKSDFRFTGITGFTAGKGLQTIGNDSFRQMTGLLHLDLAPATNLVSIGAYSFQDDTAVTNDIFLPQTLTTLGDQAFYNCKKMGGELVLPDAIATVKNTFRYCAIASFTAGKGLATIGNDSLRQMPGLLHLDLSAATNLTSIGSNCFQDDTGITNAPVLPAKLESIGALAFYNCKNMSGDIVVPKGVTNLLNQVFSYSGIRSVTALGAKAVGNQTFRGMSSLERIELGWDLDTLNGSEVLRDDAKLKAIYWRSPPAIAKCATKPMAEWDWRVNGCTNYIPWSVRDKAPLQTWVDFAAEYNADYGTILDENGAGGLPTARNAVGTIQNASRSEKNYIAYWLPDLNPATLVLFK